MTGLVLTGLFGVALGMRHALEPDHLAAVSTLAAEEKGPAAGLRLGALWGLGHSVTLLVVGGALALLEAEMPPRLTALFELAVGFVITGLGVRALVKAWADGRRGPAAPHRHHGLEHVHPAPPQHVHLYRWTLASRPLFIGALHGLAGSGALTALVLAELPTSAQRLTTIALFGFGSVVGMAMLTGLLGVPLVRLARAPRAAAATLFVVGLCSTATGGWWSVEAGARLLGA